VKNLSTGMPDAKVAVRCRASTTEDDKIDALTLSCATKRPRRREVGDRSSMSVGRMSRTHGAQQLLGVAQAMGWTASERQGKRQERVLVGGHQQEICASGSGDLLRKLRGVDRASRLIHTNQDLREHRASGHFVTCGSSDQNRRRHT
jgi:hypothetical protein